MTFPRLAFIGFGEAGSAIAGGLRNAGVKDITAFDILQTNHKGSGHFVSQAALHGVKLSKSYKDAVEGRNIIISTVTCSDAIDAARSVARHLKLGQIYLDLNSVSPPTKRLVGEEVAKSEAMFVEAAIMSPVHPNRHESPMLICGPDASKVIRYMTPFGMNLEDLGPEFGRAAATKMFRSIVFKGLEALLQECVIASDQYGVTEKVFDSIGQNYPELDWSSLTSYFMGRSIVHGERRAAEMEEVAKTLRSIDIEPYMVEATAKRIDWLSQQGLDNYFRDQVPSSYQKILEALAERRS